MSSEATASGISEIPNDGASSHNNGSGFLKQPGIRRTDISPIPFERIKVAALAQAESFVMELFPAGKRRGEEFKVGSLQGEAGASCSINVRTGLWADFATGQKGGDLIDLFAQARFSGNVADAARYLAGRLGIACDGGATFNHPFMPPPAPKEAPAPHGDWQPILPPPNDAPLPPSWGDHRYTYRDSDGQTLHYILRRDAGPDRKKEFRPQVYGTRQGITGWRFEGVPNNRPLYKLDQLAARPNAPIILCEGEKAADAAQIKFPTFVCMSWQGGAQAVDKADWGPLQARRVYIWPDNDEAGHRAAKQVKRHLPHAKLLAVSDLAEKSDAADIDPPGDPMAWIEARILPDPAPNAVAATNVSVLFDPWDDPAPVAFPTGILPSNYEDMIFALALRDGVCPGALAMAHLSAVSGAANKADRFAPYRNSDYKVPPIVWVMIIANSGQRKTALETTAFATLRKIHGDAWQQYRVAWHKWNELSAKDKKEAPEPTEPHSLIVQDATVEKVQQILGANDRGTLMVRDEIAGLLDFGRYASGSGAAERAYWLQTYEGEPYNVSRSSRKSFYIPNNAVSIYGAIQQERLNDFPDLSKDGMMQRFNMVRCSPASVSRPDVNVEREQTDLFDAAVRQIARMMQRSYTPTSGAFGMAAWRDSYITTHEGGEIIHATEALGNSLATTVTELGQGFQGTCSKLHGTHARYAMLLHLLDAPQSQIIATTTVERAGRLVCEFLLPQARDFFGGLCGSGIDLMRDIAGWLLEKGPSRILASDLSSGLRACRGMSTKQINEVLDPLVTGGWLEPESHYPNNRAWRVALHLPEQFKTRAEAERVRRQQAREFVRSIGKPKS